METGIYKQQYSGTYALDDVHCGGNETNIEQCSHNDWGTHECFSASKYFAAGVCCSNSSSFGGTVTFVLYPSSNN